MRSIYVLPAFLYLGQPSAAFLSSPRAAVPPAAVVGTKSSETNKIGVPLFDSSNAQMADSSLDVHNLRSLIDNLKPDNFEKSLEVMEPLLMNECAGEECEMYLQELHEKCGEIGMKLPNGYAPSHK